MKFSNVIIKIKFRVLFLKRFLNFYLLDNFRNCICSRVILVRFIAEVTEICVCCYINFRSRKLFVFFLRLIFLFLHLNLCLSLAFNLAFNIPENRCNNMKQSKYEINQDCCKQETGEDPGNLQLEIR
jgi:hypothetical protein